MEEKEKVKRVLLKIIERRKQLGISQADLALKLNMTFSGYFKVETGKTKLDIVRLFQIATLLQIEAKDLL